MFRSRRWGRNLGWVPKKNRLASSFPPPPSSEVYCLTMIKQPSGLDINLIVATGSFIVHSTFCLTLSSIVVYHPLPLLSVTVSSYLVIVSCVRADIILILGSLSLLVITNTDLPSVLFHELMLLWHCETESSSSPSVCPPSHPFSLSDSALKCNLMLQFLGHLSH